MVYGPAETHGESTEEEIIEHPFRKLMFRVWCLILLEMFWDEIVKFFFFPPFLLEQHLSFFLVVISFKGYKGEHD